MRRKTVGWRNWLTCHVCLVTCLLLAAAGLLATLGEPLREHLLASYYETKLTTSDKIETQELLCRLARLGRPGTDAIVRALAAPTPATRDLAYRSLLEELDRCERQIPPAAAGSQISDMAHSLAGQFQGISAAERPRVESLAMKIVALAEAVPLADRDGVIRSCQRVLSVRAEKRRPAHVARLAALRMAPAPRPHVAGNEPPSIAREKPFAQLDLARFSPPALSRADAQPLAEPRLLATNGAVALTGRPEKPRGGDRAKQVQVAAFTSAAGDSQADDEARRKAREQARNHDVIELFNQLRADQPLAVAARAELDGRGFSPRQIEVGLHLTSPDAAERLQWAEWLPGIRGVDARFWLLRLSHDPNGQVRRAAVGLLATDRDPEVIRRLQRVVVEDSDERIRDQASRALETLGEP